jgi:predicted DNA-binding protein with PD1-like motif
MKTIIQDNNNFVLRFDKDEEVFEGLVKFMKEQQVAACAFNGIGASSSVELGYFNPFIKEYRKKPYVEELEIIAFSGNGSFSGADHSIHAHGMFGRTDFSVFGGHVFKLVVSVTCEIFLTKLSGQMKREMNSDFNLNLLV